MENLINKTIAKIEKSDKLDDGVKITFTDGTVFECCWNYGEGYYKIKMSNLITDDSFQKKIDEQVITYKIKDPLTVAINWCIIDDKLPFKEKIKRFFNKIKSYANRKII